MLVLGSVRHSNVVVGPQQFGLGHQQLGVDAAQLSRQQVVVARGNTNEVTLKNVKAGLILAATHSALTLELNNLS